MTDQQPEVIRGRGGRGGRGHDGRGRSTGRGRGRGRAVAASAGGGQGRGYINNAGNKSAYNSINKIDDGGKVSREDRKAGRRRKQLETMAQKAAQEDAYFRQCQKEARSAKHVHGKDETDAAREKELFGKQIVMGINFEKYNDIKVEVRVPGDEAAVPSTMENFQKLEHLSAQLQNNIQHMKYSHPTPIQKNAIPYAMAGEDLMCCAQTGSGKTCAFLLPVVANMVQLQQQQKQQQLSRRRDPSKLEPARPKCVVLAPTRELASQIELEAQKLTHAIPTVQPVVVYGGANARAQLKELAYASGSQNDLIVVATPGRLTDFVDRNLVSLADVQFLVLDEADRMLDMGFEPQIRKLVQKSNMTPKDKRQTLLFSATFPAAIQTLAAEFLRPYVWIAVGKVGSTTDSITQVILKATADKRNKLKLVVEALENGPKGRTLVFVQKKRSATWLKKQLNKGGPDNNTTTDHKEPYQSSEELKFKPIPAEEIHGDRSQSQRETALEKFRSGKCRVLVATDVAARGLDIGGVEHVINMDLPNVQEDFDSYVHRIGRTGRAGHKGLATSLFVPGDDPKNNNGRIASLLLGHLQESEQEVPPWLEGMVAGGRGRKSNENAKPKFGGTDVRQESSRPVRNDANNKQQLRAHGGGRGRGGASNRAGSDRTRGERSENGKQANPGRAPAREQVARGLERPLEGGRGEGGIGRGRGRSSARSGRGRRNNRAGDDRNTTL